MAIAKLTVEQRTFVVQSLACFDRPHEIAAALKKEYAVTISLQGIEAYDPNKSAGKNLSKRWRAMFDATRNAFLTDTALVGISHRAVRLRMLDRMAEKADKQGNMVLAASLLEQAAKEVGNAFTNRHEHTGKDGKDLPPPAAPVTIFQLPDNGRS